ncbi:MAG: AAA family ATPase [Candidatus Norongarragalinales archaeon]
MIFKNELALKADFVPDSLPGREGEINEIVFSLEPAFEGRKARNLFLFGATGTGKTSCVKKVFGRFNEESKTAKAVFVNCWQNPTRNSVLSRIAEASGEALPRRGLGTDEVLERVAQAFRMQKASCVIALDECDRLLHNREDAVVYDLLRSDFVSAIVCITNDAGFLEKIDERIRSSLQPSALEFSRYSPVALKRILSERASLAFKPGACGEEAIALVAAYASKQGGDARVAIEALWRCGKNAEARGANKIEKRDFEMLKENPSMQKRMQGLGEIEAKIVDLLRESEGKSLLAGEIYSSLGLNDRTLRNHLKLLESKKIISVESVQLKEGRSSRISLLL